MHRRQQWPLQGLLLSENVQNLNVEAVTAEDARGSGQYTAESFASELPKEPVRGTSPVGDSGGNPRLEKAFSTGSGGNQDRMIPAVPRETVQERTLEVTDSDAVHRGRRLLDFEPEVLP